MSLLLLLFTMTAWAADPFPRLFNPIKECFKQIGPVHMQNTTSYELVNGNLVIPIKDPKSKTKLDLYVIDQKQQVHRYIATPQARGWSYIVNTTPPISLKFEGERIVEARANKNLKPSKDIPQRIPEAGAYKFFAANLKSRIATVSDFFKLQQKSSTPLDRSFFCDAIRLCSEALGRGGAHDQQLDAARRELVLALINEREEIEKISGKMCSAPVGSTARSAGQTPAKNHFR